MNAKAESVPQDGSKRVYEFSPGCKGDGAARNINKKSWVFAIYL